MTLGSARELAATSNTAFTRKTRNTTFTLLHLNSSTFTPIWDLVNNASRNSLDSFERTTTSGRFDKRTRKPAVWPFVYFLAGAVLCALWISQSHFDTPAVLFVNRFVGKSPLFDDFVELITGTYLLHGVLFVALLWLIWFKDKGEESRNRLLMGGVAAVLAGFFSRLLQYFLPFHFRPLYNVDLNLTSPLGVGSGLSHWNCFPSDHASLFFALATLILINDRRLGLLALVWAAITSSTRIYLGYHYPTDILGGAALGIGMVIASQKLPFLLAFPGF